MRIGGVRRGSDLTRSQSSVHVTPVLIVLSALAACGCDNSERSKDTTRAGSTRSVSGKVRIDKANTSWTLTPTLCALHKSASRGLVEVTLNEADGAKQEVIVLNEKLAGFQLEDGEGQIHLAFSPAYCSTFRVSIELKEGTVESPIRASGSFAASCSNQEAGSKLEASLKFDDCRR